MNLLITNTTLISKILRYKNVLFKSPPKYVILYYTQHQPIYDDMLSQGLIHEIIHNFDGIENLKRRISPWKKSGVCIVYVLYVCTYHDIYYVGMLYI